MWTNVLEGGLAASIVWAVIGGFAWRAHQQHLQAALNLPASRR